MYHNTKLTTPLGDVGLFSSVNPLLWYLFLENRTPQTFASSLMLTSRVHLFYFICRVSVGRRLHDLGDRPTSETPCIVSACIRLCVHRVALRLASDVCLLAGKNVFPSLLSKKLTIVSCALAEKKW